MHLVKKTINMFVGIEHSNLPLTTGGCKWQVVDTVV